MPLVEKIEHKKPNKQVLEGYTDIEKLTVLNSLLVEKDNFYELSYVINHE